MSQLFWVVIILAGACVLYALAGKAAAADRDSDRKPREKPRPLSPR